MQGLFILIKVLHLQPVLKDRRFFKTQSYLINE